MATRLQIYNNALLICKQRFLSSLTENIEPRRLLDQVWDSGGVRYCLEQGQWQFAMRTQMLDADPDIDTQFGFANAFDKPDDWVLTSAVCSDERFNTPLIRYNDETAYWFADITPIYVKFVSDDDAFGNDLSRWPNTFQSYVETYFASQIVGKLSSDAALAESIMKPRTGQLDTALLKARSRAAMTQATQFAAPGTWVVSRMGRRGYRNDRGNPGSLIG